MKLIHYFDYKSPYAYLAQEAVFDLAAVPGVEVVFKPYTLHIPDFLGSAELGADGQDMVGTRNAHQWRRVKYSYMDCRREANRRGLIIRGPRKIFDSSLAHIGFYFAQDQGDFRPYHDAVYERFWKRELDIEDISVLEKLLSETGYDPSGFRTYMEGDGRARHDRDRETAEEQGVFGVPSYLAGGELFWGAERLDRISERIGGG